MLEGTSRLKAGWNRSDQRRYNVPCPHCGHEQPLVWAGLQWTPDAKHCWYVCRECGAVIDEHHKPEIIRRGRWVAENPEAKARGYQINALYYPFGMGPRWLDLVEMWLAAQKDPAKLKTFINERLAETFEDPAMRAVKVNLIADRVEPRPLRPVPHWVLAATAGIDTQDNRLAVQIVGWGRGLSCWPIDYVELPGDPANEDVWVALTDLLLRAIDREGGGTLRVDAAAIDIGGHRGEAVKAYVRQRLIRRLMPVFGAVRNNAPVLGKGKLVEVNWRGQYDKRGVHIHEVGTVGIKHLLYSRQSTDAEKPTDQRLVRLSHELDDRYLGGLVSETYDPAKNRFVPRRGAPRNEPLDTWVYAYAATHHPELRLHRHTKADWDARESGMLVPEPGAQRAAGDAPAIAAQLPAAVTANPTTNPFTNGAWSFGQR
jgi:phage terminase large subunit GpA-like protein